MRHQFSFIRIVVAALFILMMGALAIRTSVVAAYADSNPVLAASFWSKHPDVLASTAMAQVGQAAARGEQVSADTRERLRTLSQRSALAPEPFLVAGATALGAGNYADAEKLFVAARQRAPRSTAARYLLADLYLRQNRIAAGLEELAVLTRILPSINAPLAPVLAQYAQTPGAALRLRQVLRDDPQLESLLLSELASDPRNADLILSLARPHQRSDDVPRWQQRLVFSLVEAGSYDRAYRLWRRFAPEVESSANISTFQRSSGTSPFTWTLAQETDGTADPDNGSLNFVFSGRKTVTLASRVILLGPGSYRLRMRISGELPDAERVGWFITCLPDNRRIANIPFSRSVSGILSARFEIPSECKALRLELKGEAQIFPENAEFSISNFQLQQVSG